MTRGGGPARHLFELLKGFLGRVHEAFGGRGAVLSDVLGQIDDRTDGPRPAFDHLPAFALLANRCRTVERMCCQSFAVISVA